MTLDFITLWQRASDYAMNRGLPRHRAEAYADFVLDTVATKKDTVVDLNHVALFEGWLLMAPSAKTSLNHN
jgi:hypothetical protein